MSYAASPIFFLMAWITYLEGPGMCSIPGDFGYLGSMWFMYVVMGAVHASPWFWLVWDPIRNTRQKSRKPELPA
jgi:hypothetical protein